MKGEKKMDISISIKVEIVEAASGEYVALFRGFVKGNEADMEKLPEISLSRVHGKCYFRVDQLHQHDGHAPAWSDEVKMKEYIERVFNEIKTKCVEKGLMLNDEIQQVKIPNILKGNPYMN